MPFNVEDVNTNEIKTEKDVVLRIPKELFEKYGIRIIIETPRRCRLFGGKRKAVKFTAGSFVSLKNAMKKVDKKSALSPELEYARKDQEIDDKYSKKNDKLEEAYVKKIDEIDDLVSGKSGESYNYSERVSQLVDELAQLHAVLIKISYSRRKEQLEHEKAFKMNPQTLRKIRQNFDAFVASKQVSSDKFNELKSYLQKEEVQAKHDASEVLDRYRDLNNVREENNLINEPAKGSSIFDNYASEEFRRNVANEFKPPVYESPVVKEQSAPVEEQPVVSEPVEEVAPQVVEEEPNKKEVAVSLVDALKRVEQNMENKPLESSMFDNRGTVPETPVAEEVVVQPIEEESVGVAPVVEQPAVEEPIVNETIPTQQGVIDTYAEMANNPQEPKVEESAINNNPNNSNVMNILNDFMAKEEERKRLKEEAERKAAQEKREALIQEYNEARKLLEGLEKQMSAEGINPDGLVTESVVNTDSGISM